MDINCMNFAKSVTYRPLVADNSTDRTLWSRRSLSKRPGRKSGTLTPQSL
jgi:hypothetical protein